MNLNITSTQKVGIGILGYGRFANKWLKDAIPNSRQARLAAVHVRSRSIQIPEVSVYSNINDMLADPLVDAIYVTSPNAFHEEHVCRALDAGKHVLCEKPMAVQPDQGFRMIEAARRNNRHLAVGHMLRFSPALEKVKALLQKGVLGTLLYARADFSYRINMEMRSWVNDSSIAGGGVLLDGGIHCLDSLRYLIESESWSVRGSVIQPAGSYVETSAACLLESADGLGVHLSAHSDAPYRNSLEVMGSHGFIKLEGFTRCKGKASLEINLEQSDPVVEVIDVSRVYENQIDAFCDMIRTDPADDQSAQNGLKNIEIIQALYQKAC